MLKLLRTNARSLEYTPIIVDVVSRPKSSKGIYPFEGVLDSITAKNFDINDFVNTIKLNPDMYEDYTVEKSNGKTPGQYVYNLFVRYYNQSKDNARVKFNLITEKALSNSSDNEGDTSTMAERSTVKQEDTISVKFQLVKYIKVLGVLSFIYKLDLFALVYSFIKEPKFEKDNYYYDLGKYISNGSVHMNAFLKTKMVKVTHDLFQRRDEYSSICRQLRRKSETSMYNGKHLKNICYWLDRIKQLCDTYNLEWDIFTCFDERIVKAGIKITQRDFDFDELYVSYDELINNAEERLISTTESILNGDIFLGPVQQSVVSECIYKDKIKDILEQFCPDYQPDSIIDYNSNDTVLVDGKIAILAINDDFKRDSNTGRLLRTQHVSLNDRSQYSYITEQFLLSGSFAVINRNCVIFKQLVNSEYSWGVVNNNLLTTGIIQKPTIYNEG